MGETCAKKCKLDNIDDGQSQAQTQAVAVDLLSIGARQADFKKQQQKVDYISAIPTECLAEIFSWLDNRNHVRIERVSRRFRRVASELSWYENRRLEFDWEYQIMRNAINSVLRRAVHVKQIHLYNPLANLLRILPQHLEHLFIEYTVSNSVEQLKALESVDYFPRTLKTLVVDTIITDNDIAHISKLFTNVLRSLPALEYLQLNQNLRPTFLPSSLRYLSLDGYSFDEPELPDLLQLAANTCPNLCGLRLCFIPIDAVDSLARMQNLAFLWLAEVPFVPLNKLFRSGKMSKLRGLGLDGGASCMLVQSIVVGCPQLEYLYLCNDIDSMYIDFSALGELARLRRLRSLFIWNCGSELDETERADLLEGLDEIIEASRNVLENLFVDWTNEEGSRSSEVDQHFVFKLLVHCTNIRRFGYPFKFFFNDENWRDGGEGGGDESSERGNFRRLRQILGRRLNRIQQGMDRDMDRDNNPWLDVQLSRELWLGMVSKTLTKPPFRCKQLLWL